VDTLIFGLLLVTAWLLMRGAGRQTALWLFAAGLVATLVLFNYHVTESLPLEF
jgi:hypothetical protein